jgi:hypothetical protein
MIRWYRPVREKKERSASEGSSTPFGWEWAEPARWVSSGIMSSRTLAESSFVTVPGTRSHSSITPSRSLRRAANSFGSFEAAIARSRSRSSCRIPLHFMP